MPESVATFTGVAGQSLPKPVQKYSGADELAILLIASAIQDVRQENHKDACASLTDAVNNLRAGILGRARDYLFAAWQTQKAHQYLLEVRPASIEHGTDPKQGIAIDNASFTDRRDDWLLRHSQTIRRLILEERFELAAAGAMWVCEMLSTGFLALGQEYKG